MRISDWSSDVCASDLSEAGDRAGELGREGGALAGLGAGLGAALGVPRLRFLGEGEAVGEVERRLEAVGQARLDAGAPHQAVDHHPDVVFALLVERRGGVHLVQRAVYFPAPDDRKRVAWGKRVSSV